MERHKISTLSICLMMIMNSVCCVAGDRSVDQDLLPWLLDEFPYLHLSPATLHSLWQRGSLQLEHLSRAEADARRRKTKAQDQVCHIRTGTMRGATWQ